MSYALAMCALISFLVVVNGIYVAGEFGIIAASKIRLTQMSDEGNAKARRVLSVRKDGHRLNRYIATAQVGITIASLALGMVAEPAIASGIAKLTGMSEHAAHSPAMALLAIVLLTYPHVVVGEMIPKALALTKPTKTALVLAGFMTLSQALFRPLVWFLDKCGSGLLKLCGVPAPDETRRLFSADELEMVVSHSAEKGLVAGSEEMMVENIFDLSERTAGDIMTPRVKIQALVASSTMAEVLDDFLGFRYTRIPVYEDSLDNVVGVLYGKDLARHFCAHGETGLLADHLHPARFVSVTTPVEEILELFRRESLQMVLVADEFGGTAGLVTFEDAVEEVVGEIQDEFDAEDQPIVRLDAERVQVSGDLLLDKLTQFLKRPSAGSKVKTVGGLLAESAEDSPRVGDLRVWEGLEFRVEAVRERRVESVQVKILPEE